MRINPIQLDHVAASHMLPTRRVSARNFDVMGGVPEPRERDKRVFVRYVQQSGET